GDLVLVRNSAVEMNLNQFKTTDRYKGPYQIVKHTTRGNYVLAEMNNTTLRQTYAAYQVIPYIS
ncbi:hypothetical protein BDZ89DRAFT_899344, partial [Hymenopellis radicata]